MTDDRLAVTVAEAARLLSQSVPWVERHVVIETPPSAAPRAEAPTPITAGRRWPTDAEVAAFDGRKGQAR